MKYVISNTGYTPFTTVAPKVGSTAPWGVGGLPSGTPRNKGGRQGQLEVGPFERVIRF
jgi:hypothetical protein